MSNYYFASQAPQASHASHAPQQVHSSIKKEEQKKDLYDIDLFVVDEKQTKETLGNLSCSICFNMSKECSTLYDSKDPDRTDCAHSFCKNCICEWDRTSYHKKTCPNCRSKYDQILTDVTKKREINLLLVHCPNIDTGCTEVTQLHKMKDHVQTCLYSTMSCNFYLCYEEFLRKDRDTHESECPKRLISCDLCQRSHRFDEQQVHKSTVCPKMIISCTNEDCTETFTRDQKDVHAQSCAFAPVTCTYLGCGVLLKLSQVAEHNKSSAEAHYAALVEQHDHEKQMSKTCIEQLTAANHAADKIIAEHKLFKKTVINLEKHEHPMTWLHTMPPNHNCDICKQKILPRDGRLGAYRCMEKSVYGQPLCDHDWCEDCVAKMYVPLRGATIASAAATTVATAVPSRIGKDVKSTDFNVIGAKVTIGRDWKWGDQHRLNSLGLDHTLCIGTVIATAETCGWLRVQWSHSVGTNTYRAGAEGQFDLKYHN